MSLTSYRDIEKMMLYRGIEVTYDAFPNQNLSLASFHLANQVDSCRRPHFWIRHLGEWGITAGQFGRDHQ